ncbi:hypothetical protein BDK51DRAFT_29893 [Blyttiomyces helicus]|uniref:Uncharacterized protein n=1 Tax=Blyttiomyces helicus TaxID=388810 RepID=A0A4P9WEZ6_9FUNG|nr:hypothetical protein BDK51DRAFT_29893 [Blyttiomyces helicus]|eukprot:RKO90972.1 hypothetical protein BDK51DRAFT_29893 [Blyttiomyces helicus]
MDSLTTPTIITSVGAPSPRSNFCGANLGMDGMMVYGGAYGVFGAGSAMGCLKDTFGFNGSTSRWSRMNILTNPVLIATRPVHHSLATSTCSKASTAVPTPSRTLCAFSIKLCLGGLYVPRFIKALL